MGVGFLRRSASLSPSLTLVYTQKLESAQDCADACYNSNTTYQFFDCAFSSLRRNRHCNTIFHANDLGPDRFVEQGTQHRLTLFS